MEMTVDKYGRVVLPLMYRRKYQLTHGTKLEILPTENYGQFLVTTYYQMPPSVEEIKSLMSEMYKQKEQESKDTTDEHNIGLPK